MSTTSPETTTAGWRIIEAEWGDRHLMPINDIQPHIAEAQCWCCPRQSPDDGYLIIHACRKGGSMGDNPSTQTAEPANENLTALQAEVVSLRHATFTMAGEIERLRVWLSAIGNLLDVDADNRGWMVQHALTGQPAPKVSTT